MLWDQISLVLNVSHQALKEIAQGGAPYLNPKTEAGRENPKPQRTSPTKLDSLDCEFFLAAIQSPKPFLELTLEQWEGLLKEPLILDWLRMVHNSKDLEMFQSLLQNRFERESDNRILALLSPILCHEKRDESSGTVDLQLVLDCLRKRKRESEIKLIAHRVKLSPGATEEQIGLLQKLNRLRVEQE